MSDAQERQASANLRQNLASDRLAEIEQRSNAATPGPWIAVDDNEGTDYFPLWAVANDEFYNPSGGDEDMWQAIHACLDTGLQSDAEFIAHARTDLPALVAALRAVLDPKVARRVAGCEIYEESCDCGDPHPPCRHSKYLYCDQHGDSADQCTAFINAQVALNSAITKALGGGA